MALRLQRRTWKNQDGSVSESWRLIIEDYTSGTRKDFYPSRKDYPRYGFHPDESFEKAREKLKVIQAHNKVDRIAEKRARIAKRIETDEFREGAFLPKALYQRFKVWLQDRRVWDDIPSKTASHLRAMRNLILDIELDPSEWPERPEKIYRWFLKNKYSLSYIDKVLPLLNDYGYFYCREFKKPFVSVPAPPPDIARRIDDANHEERDGAQAESKPILPHHIPKLAADGPGDARKLPDDQLRWMRISIYFGLRPYEVDSLTPENQTRTWSAYQDDKKTWILAVFQTKLVRISRPRRWKRIPCILPEQAEIVRELLDAKPFKRPYSQIISNKLGDGHGLYGGRKGFEKLMREKGQRFENISRWLGHTDIRRTEANYRETEAVEYDPIQS